MKRGALLALLLLVGFAALYGSQLGLRALWNPDEGRYAEIPREMLATGDLVTPRIDGIEYFEKPPLGYWAVAGSFALFGPSASAARLPIALFALLGVLGVWLAGRRLFGPAAGRWAAIVLATSPLWFGIGQTVSLDMPVSALLTASLLAFLLATRATTAAARRGWVLAFYAAAAGATLAKGLIGIAVPAMVIGVFLLLTRRWRVLRVALSPLGIALFLALGVPWHLLVARAHPEFTWFYFVHEHFLRYTTKIHARYEPPWFFVPVLLGGMFPWAVLLPRAVTAAWRARREARTAEAPDAARDERDAALFLLGWAAIVFAFFSASDSKLIPYVLPVLPPLALLVGRVVAAAREEGRARRASEVVALACCALFATAVLLLPSFRGGADEAALLGGWRFAVALALLVAGVLPLALARAGRAALGYTVGAALLLLTLGACAPRLDARQSTRPLAAVLRPLLRPDDEVVVYRDYFQDLPFYLARRVSIVRYLGELEYGAAHQPTPWIYDDAALRARWHGRGRVFLVARADRLPHDLAGTVVARADRHVVLANHL